MLTLFYRLLYIYLSIYLSLVSGGSIAASSVSNENVSGGSIAGRIVFYILYILYGEIYAIASSVSNENDSLSFEQYQNYRSQHPGPLSERSFNKWKRNGGMDEPSFKLRNHPYRGVGRHRRKNSNQKVVNVFYQ
nr:uncharacterized protein LOC124807970 isoform X2 [Hydra vulgaris]